MINRDTQLTENFRLGEFLHEGIEPDDLPTPVLENLIRLAKKLQDLRNHWKKPIHINSGYRTPKHNKAVGGSPNSQHLLGLAADIVVKGMTPQAVQHDLRNWFGGLGKYEHFTHIDLRGSRARW